MDKRVMFYDDNGGYGNRVIHLGERYYYTLYSGRIQRSFSIDVMLLDNVYFDNIINKLRFNKHEIIYTYKNMRKRLFIPVSKNFLEYYSVKYKDKDIIELSNIDLNNNVDSFYHFSLEIEIDNFRMIFERSIAYPGMIYIKVPDDENLNGKMIELFGKPQNIPELSSEKYDCGKKSFYYIVPMARIDKIIGIKRYRDTSTFGKVDGEQFTGKSEEIVLDLHNFDEKIYQIFKEHGMLEIEDK